VLAAQRTADLASNSPATIVGDAPRHGPAYPTDRRDDRACGMQRSRTPRRTTLASQCGGGLRCSQGIHLADGERIRRGAGPRDRVCLEIEDFVLAIADPSRTHPRSRKRVRWGELAAPQGCRGDTRVPAAWRSEAQPAGDTGFPACGRAKRQPRETPGFPRAEGAKRSPGDNRREGSMASPAAGFLVRASIYSPRWPIPPRRSRSIASQAH